MQIEHFFDYKSPYAWLAQIATDQLEHEFGVSVARIPYTLDIPAYLGAAALDARGKDMIGTRNAHQWRRVRYAYMDCRREANRRGLVLRGPRRIFDSRLAHAGFLYAADAGVWRAYHDEVYTRFWRRELDLEDGVALAELLTCAGADGAAFPDWARHTGLARLATLQMAAEARGVFGVPSWIVDGELYWGAERLGRVRETIALHRATR